MRNHLERFLEPFPAYALLHDRKAVAKSNPYAHHRAMFAVAESLDVMTQPWLAIPIRFCMYNLVQATGWGSPSLRTTQGRLITSLRRPPALRSYSFESESV
jgi:hypothetical protein